jgi:antitoxin VapB
MEINVNFPIQMDDPRVRADAAEKVARLRRWLADRGFDAVLISRRDNFAWLTVGGDSHVLKNTEVGVGHLLVTPERLVLFAYRMDGERLLEEELPGQGYELVTTRWYEDEPRLQALRIAGKRVAADTALPGVEDCSLELSRMHAPLTPLELARYRWLARQTGLTLEGIARWVRPGMTEQAVARRITTAFIEQGIDVDVLLTGSDARMERIRHAVPSPKAIERFVLFNPTARRWGLHANVSRCVCFGEPGARLQAAFSAALAMEGRLLGMLAPGLPYAEILACQKAWYAEAGSPEEWRNHFQGGTTGYVISDAALCQTDLTVPDGQAFDWFITFPGVMVEELALLADGKVELASCGQDWPAVRVPGCELDLPGMWVA